MTDKFSFLTTSAAIFLALGAMARADGDQESVTAQLRKEVARQEEIVRNTKELCDLKTAPQAALDAVRKDLAKARLSLANAEEKPEAALEQVRAITAYCDINLKRSEALFKIGAASMADVDGARKDRAEAAVAGVLLAGVGQKVDVAALKEQCEEILKYHVVNVERCRQKLAIGVIVERDLENAELALKVARRKLDVVISASPGSTQ